MMTLVIALAAAAFGAPVATPPKGDLAQGRAVLECRVSQTRRLTDCRVISESPPGANVGAFALKLASGFRVDPKDRRIKAGKIRLPMQFKLPGSV